MGKKQIQKVLTIFTDRAKKQWDPKQIILFGSYARGKATEYSDIDVVIVSNKFKSIPQEKRLDVLYDLTHNLYPDFHVFGYTLEEYDRGSKLTTLQEIKEKGIPLL